MPLVRDPSRALTRWLLASLVLISACSAPVEEGPSPAATAPAPATVEPVPSTEAPTPTDRPTPRPVVDPFYPSVVLVQGEGPAGFARIADGDGAIMLGHSYSAFGARCSEPTDVADRLAWAGDVPKMLYASLAPEDLDWRGKGCAGSESRLRDDAIEEFARRNLAVVEEAPEITHRNFWNELKGYDMPAETALFNDHYIRWARTIKSARPDLKLGGPYTHGAFSDETLRKIHNDFIDGVVKPHPELVDFIASGDSHRPSTFYTDIYGDRGIMLRHWQPEWYPGGHDTSNPPGVGLMIDELMRIAANPLMEGVMIWGSGPIVSDGNQTIPLWDTEGRPTDFWAAYVAAAEFTSQGEVEAVGAGRYRNGAGQTLVIEGDRITVADP